MKDFLRIAHYLRSYSNLAATSVVLTLLAAGAGLLGPWPLKILFDNVLTGRPLPGVMGRLMGPLAADRGKLLIFAIVAFLGVTLLKNGVEVLSNYVNTRIDQGIALDFRSDLLQHAQRLSMAFHDQRRSGQLIYAINFQAQSAASLLMSLQPLVESLLILLGMLWISIQIDRQLGVLSLTIVPLLYGATRYYVRHIQTRLQEVKTMEGESLAIIHEAMSMVRVIVAFGREGYEYQRFRAQAERAVDARVGLTVRQTLFSLAVNSTTALGTALVLGVGVYHVVHGRLTPGGLLVIMSYVSSVYAPLTAISSTVGSLQDHFINLRMALNLLSTEPEVKDPPGGAKIRRAKGNLAFQGVAFTYAGRNETLKEISFEAHSGQVIAIVGQTGAGKTTLVSLIPRFYDPIAGRVLLDGMDLRQITLKSLRDQISLVLQEPLLFSGSIAENIRYGRLDATMEDVMTAAKNANAHDFITRLPEQYDTVLGERGAKLSGGERQRIAVARAFLKDAPILILDEPTSSIDSKTEAVILDALDRLMVGRTTFLVAHRLSTVRHADMILVVQHGELVERGTHDELMQIRGFYRQLHDLQSGQVRERFRELIAETSARSAGRPA